MTEKEWTKYYDRWSDRIAKLDNKKILLDKVVKKYGHACYVAQHMIFDTLFEYAKRNGTPKEDYEECDVLIDEYIVDDIGIALVYLETNPFIIIKYNKD